MGTQSKWTHTCANSIFKNQKSGGKEDYKKSKSNMSEISTNLSLMKAIIY